MCNRTTNGAAVANLWVANMASCMSKQRCMLGKDGRLLNIHVASKSTDCNVIARIANVGEVLNTTNVDQHAWLRQTQFHQWDEAVAAGQKLGLVAVLPDTGESQAKAIAEDMRQSISSLGHRTLRDGERLHLQATVAVVMAKDEDEAQLLKRLNTALAQAKPRLARSA